MIFLFRYYQQLDILTKSAEQILHKILIELSTNRTTTWAKKNIGGGMNSNTLVFS